MRPWEEKTKKFWGALRHELGELVYSLLEYNLLIEPCLLCVCSQNLISKRTKNSLVLCSHPVGGCNGSWGVCGYASEWYKESGGDCLARI